MWLPPDPTAEQLRAIEALRTCRRPLLVGHERPDGDVLGSQAALAHGLVALGARPTILNPDPPPRGFDWIEPTCGFGWDRGRRLPEHDLVVLLDLSEMHRTGALAARLADSSAPTLVVDHHRAPELASFEFVFRDERAAATGILVARILVHLGVGFDAVMANGIMLAVVSDTGSFRYDNSNSEAFDVAALCASAGASSAEVHRRQSQRRDPRHPAALGALLARTRWLDEGRVALIDEPASLGLGGLEGLGDAALDVLRSVERVDVALHLRESSDGICKLSARSKAPAEVHELAERLGGGGHARAAGATLPGPLANALERLLFEVSTTPLRPDRPAPATTR